MVLMSFKISSRLRLCAFAADEAVLTKLLGDTIRFRTVGPDLSALAQQPGDFDNDADKMCYIRPAVNA